MRKSLQIKIDNKDFVIKELSIRQILNLKEKASGISGFQELAELFITECSSIPKELILDFTFSDMEEIVKAVKAVNESFFKIPEHLGLQEVSVQFMQRIKESLIKDWSESTKNVQD